LEHGGHDDTGLGFLGHGGRAGGNEQALNVADGPQGRNLAGVGF